MKYFTYFLAVLGCLPVFAYGEETEKTPQINADAFLAQKGFTVWADERTPDGQVEAAHCQAVRLTRDWYITAAHCVYDFCGANRSCVVQFDLAQSPDPLLAQARVHSNSSLRNVFIFPGYNPAQNRSSSFDVALIRFALGKDGYLFMDLDKEKELSRAEFEKKLPFYPETQAQWNAPAPRLLTFDAAVSARITPPIAVPRAEKGHISWVYNTGGQAFFVSELQHCVSTAFGVQKGNSGGGVFTAEGDLIGIVSMSFQNKNGAMPFKDADGKPLPTIQNADSYFVFTGFSSGVLAFIRSHVPQVRFTGAVPRAAQLTNQKFNRIISALDAAMQAS